MGGLITSNDNFKKYFIQSGFPPNLSKDFNDYYPKQGMSVYNCNGAEYINGPETNPFGIVISYAPLGDSTTYNFQVFYSFYNRVRYRNNKSEEWMSIG